MGRLIAIGDIHGRFSILTGLIKKIKPQKDDQIIFIGDYIDRGPDSYEVVEYIVKFKKRFPNTVTLRGNHEHIVISFLGGNQSTTLRESWKSKDGGKQTLDNYDKAGHKLIFHKEFFISLPIYHETDEYFLCHAGVRPHVKLHEQSVSDLLEIREPFLSYKGDFGKIVVHGHSVVDSPEILSNRINIDTGAGYHGPLTAIELPSLKTWSQS